MPVNYIYQSFKTVMPLNDFIDIYICAIMPFRFTYEILVMPFKSH